MLLMRGCSRTYRRGIQEHDVGLARQGQQRGERGGEAVTEPRCKLALVESDRGAIAWCMKHVVGADHDQHQLRPVARELVPATEATATLLSDVGCRHRSRLVQPEWPKLATCHREPRSVCKVAG